MKFLSKTSINWAPRWYQYNTKKTTTYKHNKENIITLNNPSLHEQNMHPKQQRKRKEYPFNSEPAHIEECINSIVDWQRKKNNVFGIMSSESPSCNFAASSRHTTLSVTGTAHVIIPVFKRPQGITFKMSCT